MKKIFLIAAAALLIGSTANAQDVFKQQGGEQNIEFLFSPLGGSPIGINGIKYRKFTSATKAIRATVFLGFTSETDIMLAGDVDDTELKMKMSAIDITIAPGMEWHFPGTDRLSPYYGAEAIIAYSSTTEKDEFLFETDVEEMTVKNGSFTFGANAICGMDYYFHDNIYIGAELGFGLQFTTDFDTVSESTLEGADTIETPNGSSLGVGPNVVGQIRAGFLF